MSDLNLYWAEEALGEPYAPQDYRWMKATRRTGLIMGGAACVLTAGVLLSGAVYLTVDRSPRVAISSYEIEVVSQSAPQPLPAPAPAPAPAAIPGAIPPAPAARPETTVDARMSQKAAVPTTTAPNQAMASKATAAPKEVKIKTAPALALVKAKADASAVPKIRIQPGKAPEVPAPPAAAPAPAKPTPAAPAASAPAPAAKPEPDTRMGISKGADSKPTDIASGEKLGIREIQPDGIVMQNGRKVKNGSPLPNGEILMGTDAGKGMVETDRRVLVLTP